MKKTAKLVLLVVIFLAISSCPKNIYAVSNEELNQVRELTLDANNSNNVQLLNVNDIEKYPMLEKLEICNYHLEDLSFLKQLPHLKELKINNCGVIGLQELEGLVNLTELDLSYNQIIDITPLEKLTNLEKLKLNTNQITDISPIKNLTKLTGLDLSENQITNIKVLKDLPNLALTDKSYDIDVLPEYLVKLFNFEHVYLDDNQISDISTIDKEVLKYTSAQKQNLKIKTNKKEISLPNAFLKNEKNTFSTENFELINCKLSKDNSKIIIEDTAKEASIKIAEGALKDSVLTVEYDNIKPNLTVDYGDTNGQISEITVTITSDEEIKNIEGWNLSDNKRKLTKKYLKNTKEQLKVQDLVGNETNITVQTKNINKPILNTSYTVTKDIAVDKGNEIIAEADKYVGNPYVLQGNSLTEGIDCSHFVHQILQICGLYNGKYIRSTNWVNVGEPVEDLEHAIAGDVLVWDGHVGFYDGYGKIVEAKGKKWGITHDRDAARAITKKTFLGIRRFTGHEKIETALNPNEITNSDVKVTIKSNKKVKAVKGWKLSKDGKELRKKYSQNTNELVKINDYEGNQVEAAIDITNIHK